MREGGAERVDPAVESGEEGGAEGQKPRRKLFHHFLKPVHVLLHGGKPHHPGVPLEGMEVPLDRGDEPGVAPVRGAPLKFEEAFLDRVQVPPGVLDEVPGQG